MKSKVMLLLCSLAVLGATPAWSVYDTNLLGVVTEVLAYTDHNIILVRLDNQPSSHPTCNPSYFALEHTADTTRVDRIYARLLLALSSGQPTKIGYDSQGNCANGWIRMHRVG